MLDKAASPFSATIAVALLFRNADSLTTTSFGKSPITERFPRTASNADAPISMSSGNPAERKWRTSQEKLTRGCVHISLTISPSIGPTE